MSPLPVPQQQKALVLESKSGQLTVQPAGVRAPGAGELLVRVDAAALNPIDWMIQAFGVFVEVYPAVIGCDGAGVVVRAGDGVASFADGDRVAFQGTVDPIKKSIAGTFTQYAIVPVTSAFKIPDNVSLEAAATMPCTLPTAAFVLYNQQAAAPSLRLAAPWTDSGRAKYAGKSALVLGGSSSVGQYAIQFAHLSGFAPIVATASPQHTAFLQSLGATHVLDRNAPDLQAAALQLSAGAKGFDLVYDAVSTPETMPLGYALTAPGGDFVVVSPPTGLPTAGGDGEQKEQEKKVHMARGLLALPGNEEICASLLGAMPNLLENGDIKPNRIEVLHGGLGGIVKGLERLRNKQVSGVKLVVLPQETE